MSFWHSSDCENYNHIDCYNNNNKCDCDCHDVRTDKGKKYKKLRAERRK